MFYHISGHCGAAKMTHKINHPMCEYFISGLQRGVREKENETGERSITKIDCQVGHGQLGDPVEKGKHFPSSPSPTGCSVGINSPVLLGWAYVSAQWFYEACTPLQAREALVGDAPGNVPRPRWSQAAPALNWWPLSGTGS